MISSDVGFFCLFGVFGFFWLNADVFGVSSCSLFAAGVYSTMSLRTLFPVEVLVLIPLFHFYYTSPKYSVDCISKIIYVL